jgi:hypothetical protein
VTFHLFLKFKVGFIVDPNVKVNVAVLSGST